MIKESELKKQIEILQAKVFEKKSLIQNEENTKQSLINPFLVLLGYDVHNVDEVEFEYNANFSYKKSDKVDYAIKFNEKPLFFIEAKKVMADLDMHIAQLEYYMSTNDNVKIGILTNGIVYRFYSYFEKSKKMDKMPFFIFDFENITDEAISILLLFCKDNLNLTELLKKGEELWYYNKITDKLKQILTKPNDDFIRLLAKDYSPTKITAGVLEKFKPIVNKAITTAITDLTQEALVEEVVDEKGKMIVTTEKELKAFEMTKALLVKANKDISNVDYKDTVSYFGIYNHNVNGWFVRFVLDQQPTLAMIRLEYTLAKEIPTDLKMQPLASKGITKVFIESVEEVKKLEPFILRSFEMVE